MAIEFGVGFVASVGGVQLELVHAVGVVIAGVALDLHGIRERRVFEAPLVRFPAFANVVDQLKTLKMLVRLAVELRA